jgi:small subunit ribosomal protein S4
MARNLGPKSKIERRIGERLHLKGARSYSAKDSFIKRSYPPGIHGPKGHSRVSDYGVQLKEKQKAKAIFGLLERQFRKYYAKAVNEKGETGTILLQFLETRLDNILFKASFASSRNQARQLINHDHILVNGKKLNIPSYRVKAGDKISLREQSQKIPFLQESLKNLELQKIDWLEVDGQAMQIQMLREPNASELSQNIDTRLIIELYSR